MKSVEICTWSLQKVCLRALLHWIRCWYGHPAALADFSQTPWVYMSSKVQTFGCSLALHWQWKQTLAPPLRDFNQRHKHKPLMTNQTQLNHLITDALEQGTLSYMSCAASGLTWRNYTSAEEWHVDPAQQTCLCEPPLCPLCDLCGEFWGELWWDKAGIMGWAILTTALLDCDHSNHWIRQIRTDVMS